jgi:hypothetical protein
MSGVETVVNMLGITPVTCLVGCLSIHKLPPVFAGCMKIMKSYGFVPACVGVSQS